MINETEYINERYQEAMDEPATERQLCLIKRIENTLDGVLFTKEKTKKMHRNLFQNIKKTSKPSY